MRQIKALHLLPPGFGGIDAYVFNNYKYMDQEKFRFDFLTQNQRLKDAEQYKDFSYGVHLLPATAASDRDRFADHVRNVLRTGYDVLHLHTSFWTGFLIEEIARKAGVPKVIVHSHSSFIDEVDSERRAGLLRRHEEIKRMFRQELATDFWACSKTAAEWLFGPQIPKENIRIMKNGIDTDRFHFDGRKRRAMRAALNLGDAFVLGAAGRMCYQKNYEFLIALFAVFHGKYRNSKLIIVGDGELREKLEAQIRKENLQSDVLLPGWKGNVEDYMQAMDCFLFPSRFEGLGIAILEAVASGLPCVISDVIPEEVTFTGHTRSAPLDISEWVSAIEKIGTEENDRTSGGEAVRAAGYDVRRQAEILEELYRA